jgi:hypothetical protein
MSGDLRQEPFPDLERVLPVQRFFTSRNGGHVVVTSVDLWSDRVSVHFAYQITTHPLLGPSGHAKPGPHWSLADDVGTVYKPGGGGGGGSELAFGHEEFKPGVPVAARSLLLSSPDLAEPIEVRLTP